MAQRIWGNSVPGPRAVFSHTMPKNGFSLLFKRNMAQRIWGNSVPGIFIIPIILVGKKHTKLIYHMPWLYQLSVPFHRSHKKTIENFEKIPPLHHGGPEMKFTYFNRNCWKKNSLK